MVDRLQAGERHRAATHAADAGRRLPPHPADKGEHTVLIREPVAAGRFYPGSATALQAEVRAWLARGASSGTPECGARPTGPLHGVMLPHAGYVYCGAVIGATLAASWADPRSGRDIPRRLLALCPNHTGMGHPLGVWPEGFWRTPLGDTAVDAELADALCACGGGFAADTASHAHEHSIEVLLPFLQYLAGGDVAPLRITPVCVGVGSAAALRAAGPALADVLRRQTTGGEAVGIVVSSDMNHYEDQETTLRKDARALAKLLSCDADGLLDVTRRERITMCGAAPMSLALFAARAAGTPWAELCAHDTSAAASGDARQVVGYAGVRFGWS